MLTLEGTVSATATPGAEESAELRIPSVYWNSMCKLHALPKRRRHRWLSPLLGRARSQHAPRHRGLRATQTHLEYVNT